MKLTTKKKLAREILAIIATLALIGVAFIIGRYLEDKANGEVRFVQSEIEKCYAEIDSAITEFRKNSNVDMLYKLQSSFSHHYIQGADPLSQDQSNYSFWINVRKSIEDNTFNFTYASDEIVDLIYDSSELNEPQRTHFSKLNELLHDHRRAKLNHQCYLPSDSIKKEFAEFADYVKYEAYLPSETWDKYETLRAKHIASQEALAQLQMNLKDYEEIFVTYTFLACILLLFGLRYLYFLLKWANSVLKAREEKV
jgi:hypothetical protein